ncbi:MAG TPA: hypothetical protein VND64_28150 [Pirellulales bacterium]|nr:hypothetical protein [Pirellulales bacterium]
MKRSIRRPGSVAAIGPSGPLEELPRTSSLARPDGAPTASSEVALVMLVAGVCGVYFGLTSAWQIPVESAQAVAGVVSYPADNPFYMYHIQSWTLLHQVPAAALACGLSEPFISLVLGCLAAVLSFEALALSTLAFSRDRFFACAVPLICLLTMVYQECGAVYQTHLLSDTYWTTYGVTGNAYVMCAWSLFGLRFHRSAALLCGLAPAVHPLLGTWCAVFAAAALACDWRAERARAMTMARWFGAGALVALASFALQRFLARGVPSADPELASRLLEAFVAAWDNHRFPYPLNHIEWKIGWCTLAVASAALAWHAERLPRESLVLLRAVSLSSLASLVLCPLTHFLDRLPQAIAMAMPGRFVNLAALAFPALAIGLMARWRHRFWSVQGLLAGLMVYCLLRTLMLKKQLMYVPAASKVFVVAGLILVYLLATVPRGGRGDGARRIARFGALACLIATGWAWRGNWQLAALAWLAAPLLWFARRKLTVPGAPALRTCLYGIAVACGGAVAAMALGFWLAIGLAAAALAPTIWCGTGFPARLERPGKAVPRIQRRFFPTFCEVVQSLRFRRAIAVVLGGIGLGLIGGQLSARADAGFAPFRRWSDDPVFSAARRGEGLILTAPRMGIVQLRTRRGVVLNGEAMNQITYVPASGPSMNRVLTRIYGDDMLKPRPQGWIKLGGLLDESGREIWERRGPEEWRQLGREFGFTNVLTYGQWRLELPVVARDKNLILYGVP